MCYIKLARAKGVIKMAKTKTSTEVKNRWNAKTYQRYTVNLRKDEDAEIIQFVTDHKDEYGTSDIFRAGVEALKN